MDFKKILSVLFILTSTIMNGVSVSPVSNRLANVAVEPNVDSQEVELILLLVSGYNLYQKMGGNDNFPLYSSKLNDQLRVNLLGKAGELNSLRLQNYEKFILAQLADLDVDIASLNAYLKKISGKNMAEKFSRASNIINALTAASEVSIPGAHKEELLAKSAMRFAVSHSIVSHTQAGKYVDQWLANNQAGEFLEKAGSSALSEFAAIEAGDKGSDLK